MTTRTAESKWWLAALLLPVGPIGAGFLFALSAPFNQNDWLGMRFVAPVVYGLLAACVLSCVLTVVSFVKRERRSGAALVSAIPSVCFLVWFTAAYTQSRAETKRQAIGEIARRKHEDEKFRIIGDWRNKLRATPDLITSDDFWRTQNDPDQTAHWGLVWLLQEESFDVTGKIKDFVLVHFPDDYVHLAHRKLLTKGDLESVIRNPKTDAWPREFASRALKEGNYKSDVTQ